MNSDYKKSLWHESDKKRNNMNVRLIDFKRGNPYVWKRQDYDEIINTEHLFARKFDDKVDKQIIDKIYSYLYQMEGNENV